MVDHNKPYADGSNPEIIARKILRVFDNFKELEESLQKVQRISKAHEHIVAVLDHGKFGNTPPRYFIDMELCGENLGQYLLRRGFLNSRIGALVLTDVQEIMRQTAIAIAFIHKHGEMHQNLKPENSSNLFQNAESNFQFCSPMVYGKLGIGGWEYLYRTGLA